MVVLARILKFHQCMAVIHFQIKIPLNLICYLQEPLGGYTRGLYLVNMRVRQSQGPTRALLSKPSQVGSSLIIHQNLLTCTDRNSLFEGADPSHLIIYIADKYVIILVTDQSCVMIYTVDQSCYCLCNRQKIYFHTCT